MIGDAIYHAMCAALSLGVLLGLAMMSKVATAVKGNLLSAVCVAGAVAITLVHYGILSDGQLWICMAIGLIGGLYWSSRLKMIEMPQVVALLNGFGGAASALVGVLTLRSEAVLTVFAATTAGLALLIGMVTLSGSMVAAAKLHGIISQKPAIWKGHQGITIVLLVASVASLAAMGVQAMPVGWTIVMCAVMSALFGFVFAMRVGGADMPITISLLNSLSGVAGAIAGLAIGDVLLVVVGGIVGASGLLLTQIMCRAMNRRLYPILLGKTAGASGIPAKAPVAKPVAVPLAAGSNEQQAADFLENAKRVIIVPGYGMALAQAQQLTAELADTLERGGATVDFAIHPVAGRMPGHMNVLLAEANVAYEKLREMDDINGEFADCDVAVVIGANDVVNPAANTAKDTPIYGMPVLDVGKARRIVICNYDRNPGYAGVDNPLYDRENATMLLGNAADTIRAILGKIK